MSLRLVMWRCIVGWHDIPGRWGSVGGTFWAPAWPWLIRLMVRAKASHRITQDMIADPDEAYWRIT
jgi:hypothetical protein